MDDQIPNQSNASASERLCSGRVGICKAGLCSDFSGRTKIKQIKEILRGRARKPGPERAKHFLWDFKRDRKLCVRLDPFRLLDCGGLGDQPDATIPIVWSAVHEFRHPTENVVWRKHLKGKVISAPTPLQSGDTNNVRYLEHEKEFEAHIWSDCSTHEYIQTSKYEGPTPSELEDREDFRFGPAFFFAKKSLRWVGNEAAL